MHRLALIATLTPLSLHAAPSICIDAYRIDHTDVQDARTILFTMRDHTVYRNVLPFPCPELRFDTRGFSYTPTDPGSDQLCSNLVTIHLNTTGAVCELGTFEKLPKKP